MTSTTETTGEPRREARSFRLVLELKADGDLPTGTIGPASGSPPVAFHGWIGLMSAISRLLSDPDPLPPPPGPPA